MVKSIFSLLGTRQTSILSGAAIIMVMVLMSKILGLARDRLLAHIFTPDTTAIFFAAFRLPDLIFQLLILGVMSVAFIPIFTEYLETKNKSEAFALAQSLMVSVLILFIVVTVLVYLFIDQLTYLVVPGFSPEQRVTVATLTKIILIGQIILAIGSFFVGVLQSFQRFIIPALAAVFYNIGIILGILFLAKPLGIVGPAVGVIVGAILHVLVQLPLVISMGFRINLKAKIFHPGVAEIAGLMSMRTVGLAAEQINETVGIILSSLISTASVTYLTFASHLQVVPIGLFGATIAQAALPVLSSERARGRPDEFKATFLTTFHQILFLALPATAILVVLKIPVVRLIFGASQFDWPATVLTGMTLAYLSIGLAVQSISLLLVRGFYAMKDTRTPVLVSLLVVLANIALSFYFVRILNLEVWSIGLAFSISSIISGLLLFLALDRKVGGFEKAAVFQPFFKMLMATIIMGVALYVPIKLLDQVIFDTTRTINLLLLTGLSSIFALSIYIILVWFMKVRELSTYIDLLKRIGKYQTRIKSEELLHKPESI